MSSAYLECVEGKSNKFYEISYDATEVTTRYGACGKDGTRGSKSFDTEAEAKKFFDKTVAEKTKKGYKPVGKPAADEDEEAEPEEPEEAEEAKEEITETAVPAGKDHTVYLECVEGKSNKFYEISHHGTEVETRYGACGKDGTRGSKSFGSVTEAQKFFDKTVAEKVKKGYKHVGGKAAATEGEEAEADEPAEAAVEEEEVEVVAPKKRNAKKRNVEEVTEPTTKKSKARKTKGT
jgi:predicted DNA-binding WGR domain protein